MLLNTGGPLIGLLNPNRSPELRHAQHALSKFDCLSPAGGERASRQARDISIIYLAPCPWSNSLDLLSPISSSVMAAVPAGDRFSTVTPDDHGGLIYIATFMAFTYSSVTFLTRCFIKWNLFGMDDWAMVAAQVREPKSLRGRSIH